MKITNEALRKMIREEISNLNEQDSPSGRNHPHADQWFVGDWSDWSAGHVKLGELIEFVEDSLESMNQTNAHEVPRGAELLPSGKERMEAAQEMLKLLTQAQEAWGIDSPL